MNFNLSSLPDQLGTKAFEEENATVEGGQITISFDGDDKVKGKTFECVLSMTVQDVKAWLAQEAEVEYTQVKLLNDGKMMPDPLSLVDLGISGAAITLTVELS